MDVEVTPYGQINTSRLLTQYKGAKVKGMCLKRPLKLYIYLSTSTTGSYTLGHILVNLVHEHFFEIKT
jgi:hypothetical protein